MYFCSNSAMKALVYAGIQKGRKKQNKDLDFEFSNEIFYGVYITVPWLPFLGRYINKFNKLAL